MARHRILIDGYNLNLQTGTGVATYARNLSFANHALGNTVDVLYGNPVRSRNPLLREVTFFDPSARKPPGLLRRAIEHMPLPLPVTAGQVPATGAVLLAALRHRLPHFDALWNFPRLFERAYRVFDAYGARLGVSVATPVDIAHWTYPLPLRLAGAKNIYTMHDLVPLRLPYATLDSRRRYFRIARLLAERADHIVTVSETSRRDIMNLLGVPESRVTNTYQAVSIPQKFLDKPEEHVRREIEGLLNLEYQGYMLFYGAIEPKKNVGRLIEGYLASRIETPLVIIGKAAWDADAELKLMNIDTQRYSEQIANRTFDRRRILRLDYAPFSMLVSLVRGAKAVLFPSLYEGFGLPVLEAMTLGTPVLTSKEGSLLEIVGEDAVLVDPYDTREIADAIRALDTDAGLRARLAEAGPRRAALFSVEAYERRLADLYDRLSEPQAGRA